jgi:hypothetical protein
VVADPPGNSRVHLIIGEGSKAFSAGDRQRAAQLAASGDRVTLDVLPAGHWVHVDDPQGTLNKLLQHVGSDGAVSPTNTGILPSE